MRSKQTIVVTINHPKIRVMRLLLLVLIFLSLYTTSFSQTFSSISSTQNETNFYSGYTLSFSIATQYTIGVDYFEITFPTGFYVPTSIDASSFLVSNKTDGANPTGVEVSGQVVRLYVPVSYFNNGPPASRQNTGTIQILASAKIRNPSSAGTYNIDLSSNLEGTFGSSPRSVSIVTTSTNITTPSVSPNTSVELRSAQYNISFTTGQGGYLTTSSTINVTFPAGTTVPTGSISGVTVNNASTDAVGDGTTRVITVAVPSDIDNEASVQVAIGKSAGVKNPTASGTNSLTVSTSSESSAQTSSNYSISSADNLSFSDISLSNDTVNAATAVTVEFVVSNTGALSSSFGDRVSIKFPSAYNLPGAALGSDVVLTNLTSGFSGSPASLTIDADSIYFATPISISNGNEVRVEFLESLGITNPSTAGSYQLSAGTYESGGTTIDAETNSNPYPVIVSTSTLSNITVSLSNNAASATGVTYTLSLTTGDYGKLTAGNEIEIEFPATTTFDSGGSTAVTINGNASSHVELGTIITATVPAITIDNNQTFSIVISNVRNATSAGPYVLTLHSTPEPTDANSSTYNLGSTAVTSVSVALTPNQVNQAGQYTLTVVGASQLNSGFKSNQAITITFPEGTTMPSSIATTSVSLNGGAAGNGVGGVAVNTSTRTVVITVTTNNFNLSTVRFLTSAAILNPVIPRTSYYTLNLNTSENTVSRTSSTYNVIANTTSVTVNSVTATSAAVNVTASYAIAFTPGAFGKLAGGIEAGSSTVTVQFPAMVTVPASISASTVKINNVTVAAAVVLSSGAGGSVQLTLASGQTLPASTQANILFNTSAGLQNGATPGTYTVAVATSNETTNSTQTNNLTLTVAPSLAVNSITVTPNTVNASAAYNINVLIGTTVLTGETITLTFPTNVYIPNPFSKSYVLVDGSNPTINPTVSTNQLIITSPKDLTAGNSYSIQISSLGNVLNPQLTGTSYVVQVTTAHESAVNSPTYTITSTSTTVSSASVSLSAQTPSTTNVNYTISFSTGSNGRLLSGTSTITIRFPSGTAYGTLSATVDGIATAAPSRSTNDVTITVPASAAITNSDAVVVVLSGITNPSINNTYSLQVKTSVENTFNSSTGYTITNTGSLTINSLAIGEQIVNAATTFTLNLTSAAMTANTDYFVITLPVGSTIPNSISTTAVTVNVNGGGAVNAFNVTVNLLSRTVTIYTPTAVTAGNTVEIIIDSSSLLLNPKEPGDYDWKVKSSVQLTDATSATFAIAPSTTTELSNLVVTVSPQSNVIPVAWTWSFNTGNRGALQAGVSTIYLDFDQSVFTVNPVPTSSVKVLGSTVTTIVKNGSVLEIRVPADVTIGNNFPVEVTFTDAAGIQVDPGLTTSSASPSIMKAATNSTPTTSGTNDYTAYTSAETNLETNPSNPLPVELSRFEVILDQATKKPLIKWTTQTETQNYGFTIQRKPSFSDSVITEPAWTDIAFISGAGYSYENINYEILDKEISISGNYSYRLLQTDFDGKVNHIGLLEFIFEEPHSVELKQNFPNPFNPTTVINYQIPVKQKVLIEVYDIIGRKIQTLVNAEQLAGQYTVTFNGSNVASGVYFVRLKSGGSYKIIKMTLLK
ncbi:T9SS type A sorting domain-containing protein [bacterium]|nr:MAG: T9SS type A sorting domain-containing protein [bacterium]